MVREATNQGVGGFTIYEGTEHRGNVMITFNDKKIGVDVNSDGLIDYYTAEVVNANDYYSSGMPMPGRKYSIAGSSYRYGFNGMEKDNEMYGEGNAYDFGARIQDPRLMRWLSVDPLAEKYPSYSPYNFCLNNSILLMDPDGQEPIKPQAGTVSIFISVFNNTPSKMGMMTGANASQAMLRLGSTEWNWKQFRPLPISTPYFNKKDGRYIYTEKGGWVDMVHFLFFAGKAYGYKQEKAEGEKMLNAMKEAGIPYSEIPKNLISKSMLNPAGEAVQDGYIQEKTDSWAAKHSAYSYEDLPSDKFGADFGANYFDPNSKLTLGEQLQNYLNDKLKATSPEKAPNYSSLPTTEPTDRPTRTNKTTTPVYVKDNP